MAARSQLCQDDATAPISCAPGGAEEALFESFDNPGVEPRPVFILGAPRTGSTVLYQATANAFGLPYISNFTNTHFQTDPLVGLAIQKSIDVEIEFESAYGKTDGAFQPSEGSGVMSNWFGGGHPSQTVSTGILDGREPHFKRTLRAVQEFFQLPLLIKNAWHCFRVPYLASALPGARFVWIRRDIRDAALSDLEARHKTKGDPTEWNSATPANVDQLRSRPPLEQVVENQLEFNNAIAQALSRNASGRSIEIWYEDFITNPNASLKQIGALINLDMKSETTPPRVSMRGDGARALQDDERNRLEHYVAENQQRFEGHAHASRGSVK